MKSGNLNFLEPSGPLQACNGTDLPLLLSRCLSSWQVMEWNLLYCLWLCQMHNWQYAKPSVYSHRRMEMIKSTCFMYWHLRRMSRSCNLIGNYISKRKMIIEITRHYYNCCTGKAKNITYCECVFVALDTQRAMRMPRIVLPSVARMFILHFPHRLTRDRFRWPTGLRRVSAAFRLQGLRVRIPLGAFMSVSCECCVLSGRSLCDGKTTEI